MRPSRGSREPRWWETVQQALRATQSSPWSGGPITIGSRWAMWTLGPSWLARAGGGGGGGVWGGGGGGGGAWGGGGVRGARGGRRGGGGGGGAGGGGRGGGGGP